MTIQLAKNGKPLVVLAAKKTDIQASYAVRELRYYLGMITGAPFELVEPEAVPAKTPCILLDQKKDRKLGDDGFRLKTTGNQ